jgi:hypothetical protein
MAEDEPIITLKDYLDENKDILTILGVFVAVTVLAGSLSIKLVALFISFFSFTCAMIILLECWRRPTRGKPSERLYFFKYALTLLALTFFVYWFIIFDLIYADAISLVLAVFLMEGVVWILKKLTNNQKLKLITVQAVLLVIAILIVAGLIGNAIKGSVQAIAVGIAAASAQMKGSIQ